MKKRQLVTRKIEHKGASQETNATQHTDPEQRAEHQRHLVREVGMRAWLLQQADLVAHLAFVAEQLRAEVGGGPLGTGPEPYQGSAYLGVRGLAERLEARVRSRRS